MHYLNFQCENCGKVLYEEGLVNAQGSIRKICPKCRTVNVQTFERMDRGRQGMVNWDKKNKRL